MSDRAAEVAVVYLAWGPLGGHPIEDFLHSYRTHAAGVTHELVVLLNGVSASQRSALLQSLAGTPHRVLELNEPMQDLAAYGVAAQRLPHRLLCLMNSYSVILAEGWLATLLAAHEVPGVAIAGASGSWESQAEWRRGSIRHWIPQLRRRRERRQDFPPFPNPHIRTTSFVIERELLLELGLQEARDKRMAYTLESGWQSITRRLRQCGLRVVVVGRDRRSYDADQWPGSRTYRSGDQGNLLVSDNRTREWLVTRPWLRRRQARDAWGHQPTVGRAFPR